MKINFFLIYALFLCFLVPNNVLGNNEVHGAVNEVVHWRDNYYDSIPKDTLTSDVSENENVFKNIHAQYDSNAFNYSDKKYQKSNFWDRVGRWFSDFFKSIAPNWDLSISQIVLYLLYIIGGASVLYILYRIIFTRQHVLMREVKEKETENELVFVEKNLERIDIQSYIDKALKNENWNLAIRYLQLGNLQLLAKKDLIEWDYRKTNQDFLYEIKDKKLKKHFENSTTVFNYVWYGDFKMDRPTFERLKVDFMNLKKALS